MSKRPRRPPPAKPPIRPRPEGSGVEPHISAFQEALIGRVIVIWGRLEAILQDVIWALLGMEIADGRLITARLDVRPKLEMIETLGPRRIADAALLARLLDACDLIANRNGDRNFIVHGNWWTFMPHNVPAAMSLREKPNEASEVVLETFPAGRMREIINDLDQALTRLRDVYPALQSLPRTHEPQDRPALDTPPTSPEPPMQSELPHQPKGPHR